MTKLHFPMKRKVFQVYLFQYPVIQGHMSFIRSGLTAIASTALSERVPPGLQGPSYMESLGSLDQTHPFCPTLDASRLATLTRHPTIKKDFTTP